MSVEQTAPAIEFADVSFRYASDGAAEGEGAGIAQVSLRVLPGECVVLTGPSGSGKTTITRVANGLAPAYWPGTLTGTIRLLGADAETVPLWERGRMVGSVFQDPASQFFSSDLAGEVAFGCENYGFAHREVVALADAAISSFGLDDVRGRPLDALSSGEKQRVAVASACAPHPAVVVCDEPTANLDEEGALLLARHVARLKAEGRAVLVSEHRLAWLAGIADRYVYVRDGSVLWQRSAAQMESLGEDERAALGLRSATFVALPDLPSPSEARAAEAGSSTRRPSQPVLETCGLTCSRGGSTLWSAVSLAVWPGQIAALTGRNGAGKSTLALVLAGLERPDAGTVRICGATMRPGARRAHVWYGSNDTAQQFFTSSVSDEVLLGRTDDEALLERARMVVRGLGLYPLRDAHPATLSGGQKLRLMVACGLLSDRPVLIFDEPTSGLDGGSMTVVADALSSAAAQGRAIVVITHDGELAKRCCTCRLRMEDLVDGGC